MTLKDELPTNIGAQYATREEWRNNSRRNDEAEPKRKQSPGVDVSGGLSHSTILSLPQSPGLFQAPSNLKYVKGDHLLQILSVYFI